MKDKIIQITGCGEDVIGLGKSGNVYMLKYGERKDQRFGNTHGSYWKLLDLIDESSIKNK